MFSSLNTKKTVLALAFAALSSAPAYATEVTDQLDISGKAYIGLNSQKVENFNAATQTTTTQKNATGLTVDRFYLQAKYQVNDQWFGTIVTDVNNEQNNVTLKRNTNVFLKYAYVEGKFSDALQVRLGLSNTPWIGYEEKLWAHRYVAQVVTDFFKMDDSADYGVGFKGKVMDDMVEYWITYSNGGGYGKPNASKAMDLSGRFTVHPIEGMDISAGFRSGYRGNKTFNAVNPIKEDLTQGLISYGEDDEWRVGGDFVQRVKKDNVATTQTDTIYNIWGWARFDEFGIFGRYDNMKSTPFGSAISAKTAHYIAGIEYFEDEGMTFSVAVDTTRVTSGNNTWITTATGDTSKSTKIGLYSEFKF